MFEASSVLRDLCQENGENLKGAKDARAFLNNHGMDVVSKRLVSMIESSLDISDSVVFTGLRTIEEALFIARAGRDVRFVGVFADERIRFERHLRRARDKDEKTFSDFRVIDQDERNFGLLDVAGEVAHYAINNEGSFEQFFSKIDRMIDVLEERKRVVEGGKSELERSLLALSDLGRPAECSEISSVTSNYGQSVKIYNTNRALKATPSLARRVEKKGQRLQYELTSSGRAAVALLKLIKE